MTGTTDRMFSLPVPAIGIAVAWVVVWALLIVGVYIHDVRVMAVSMALANAAAAWTAIYGVRCSSRRIGRAMVAELNLSHEARLMDVEERIAEEVAVRVLRRLELRELHAQVAHLTKNGENRS